MGLAYVFCGLVLGVELLLGAALALTLTTGLRAWPPPQRSSWQYRVMWMLTWAGLIGFVALGVADWDSFILDHWIRYPVGAILMIAGLGLVGWSVRSLGVRATTGLAGDLVTTGIYGHTRNPQYLGEIIWMLGYAILTNSTLTLVTALVGCVLFYLVALVEEPWLRERHGTSYEDYEAEVPRFAWRARSR